MHPVVMGRGQEPATGARPLVGRGQRDRLRIGRLTRRLERDDEHRGVSLEPEACEPATGVGVREPAARELVEEVALEPPLRVGHGAGLRELDREQAERVAGHDPVELAELLGFADGEERLDAALRAHRLDPDVVAPVDQRER